MDWEKLKQQIKTEPRKTLRFVVGLSITLMILWVMVLMQSETGSGAGYVNMNDLKIKTGEEGTESQLPVNVPDDTSEEKKNSSGVLFLLVIIGAGAGFYGYLIRKRNKSNGKSNSQSLRKLSLLESIELPPDQKISIVKVCNEYWVVGSGSQGMNLLKVLGNEEWKDLEFGSGPQEKPAKKGFMNLLNSVRNAELSTTNGSGAGSNP